SQFSSKSSRSWKHSERLFLAKFKNSARQRRKPEARPILTLKSCIRTWFVWPTPKGQRVASRVWKSCTKTPNGSTPQYAQRSNRPSAKQPRRKRKRRPEPRQRKPAEQQRQPLKAVVWIRPAPIWA